MLLTPGLATTAIAAEGGYGKSAPVALDKAGRFMPWFPVFNLTGQPAISLPAGFGSRRPAAERPARWPDRGRGDAVLARRADRGRPPLGRRPPANRYIVRHAVPPERARGAARERLARLDAPSLPAGVAQRPPTFIDQPAAGQQHRRRAPEQRHRVDALATGAVPAVVCEVEREREVVERGRRRETGDQCGGTRFGAVLGSMPTPTCHVHR